VKLALGQARYLDQIVSVA